MPDARTLVGKLETLAEELADDLRLGFPLFEGRSSQSLVLVVVNPERLPDQASIRDRGLTPAWTRPLLAAHEEDPTENVLTY